MFRGSSCHGCRCQNWWVPRVMASAGETGGVEGLPPLRSRYPLTPEQIQRFRADGPLLLRAVCTPPPRLSCSLSSHAAPALERPAPPAPPDPPPPPPPRPAPPAPPPLLLPQRAPPRPLLGCPRPAPAASPAHRRTSVRTACTTRSHAAGRSVASDGTSTLTPLACKTTTTDGSATQHSACWWVGGSGSNDERKDAARAPCDCHLVGKICHAAKCKQTTKTK